MKQERILTVLYIPRTQHSTVQAVRTILYYSGTRYKLVTSAPTSLTSSKQKTRTNYSTYCIYVRKATGLAEPAIASAITRCTRATKGVYTSSITLTCSTLPTTKSIQITHHLSVFEKKTDSTDRHSTQLLYLATGVLPLFRLRLAVQVLWKQA